MNIIGIKSIFCLLLMIAFLIIALITNDVINLQLSASLGVILGLLSLKFVENKTQEKNGKQ